MGNDTPKTTDPNREWNRECVVCGHKWRGHELDGCPACQSESIVRWSPSVQDDKPSPLTTDALTARVIMAIRLRFPHYPITEPVACEAVRATLSEILPEIVCVDDHMMIARKKRETQSG